MNFFLAWLGALLMPRPDAIVGSGLDYLDASICEHPIVGLFLFYFILTNLVLGPVQSAAHPAAGRRAHRGRPAAAGTGTRLGAAGALRDRARHPGRVPVAVPDPRLRSVPPGARDDCALGDRSAASPRPGMLSAPAMSTSEADSLVLRLEGSRVRSTCCSISRARRRWTWRRSPSWRWSSNISR